MWPIGAQLLKVVNSNWINERKQKEKIEQQVRDTGRMATEQTKGNAKAVRHLSVASIKFTSSPFAIRCCRHIKISQISTPSPRQTYALTMMATKISPNLISNRVRIRKCW